MILQLCFTWVWLFFNFHFRLSKFNVRKMKTTKLSKSLWFHNFFSFKTSVLIKMIKIFTYINTWIYSSRKSEVCEGKQPLYRFRTQFKERIGWYLVAQSLLPFHVILIVLCMTDIINRDFCVNIQKDMQIAHFYDVMYNCKWYLI